MARLIKRITTTTEYVEPQDDDLEDLVEELDEDNEDESETEEQPSPRRRK